MTFLPKKVIFPSKCTCISSTISTLLPNNPVCFYNENFQKVNFSSNCSYNTRHFIDFSPEKSDFFSKFACISSTILTFLPNNPSCLYTKNSQKVNFSSNCAYNTASFLGQKRAVFDQKRKNVWDRGWGLGDRERKRGVFTTRNPHFRMFILW